MRRDVQRRAQQLRVAAVSRDNNAVCRLSYLGSLVRLPILDALREIPLAHDFGALRERWPREQRHQRPGDE